MVSGLLVLACCPVAMLCYNISVNGCGGSGKAYLIVNKLQPYKVFNDVAMITVIGGFLAGLSIGLLTDQPALCWLICLIAYLAFMLLLGIVAMFNTPRSDASALLFCGFMLTIGAAILLLIYLSHAASPERPERELYLGMIPIYSFIAVRSIYQARGKPRADRHKLQATGVSIASLVALVPVHIFIPDNPVKTITEIILIAIMVSCVLTLLLNIIQSTDDNQKQLDTTKADPFYAEQLNVDKVKEQR